MIKRLPIEENFDSLQEENEYLRSHIDKLEASREKLVNQLMKKEENDVLMNIDFTEDDLVNFKHFDKCDQKLLAIMFWDKLTDEQKKIFPDWEFKQLHESYNKRVEETMNDPTKMRQYFLKGSAPILDSIISMANGESKNITESYAFREVWEVLRGIITAASNPAPMIDLRGKDISAQIDEILSAVTKGDITFNEAKEYMSLVSSGFNLQELPKLMSKLEALEQL
jgi:hypothetical protein